MGFWQKLGCWWSGHRWVERSPHHMWSLNDYDCSRCGAFVRRGIFS
jgi:hypothetical protein